MKCLCQHWYVVHNETGECIIEVEIGERCECEMFDEQPELCEAEIFAATYFDQASYCDNEAELGRKFCVQHAEADEW